LQPALQKGVNSGDFGLRQTGHFEARVLGKT